MPIVPRQEAAAHHVLQQHHTDVHHAWAGVERLAFSITWDLTPQGKILGQWAGRSIIRSCVKLAYGHAQDMIEGKFAGLPDQEAPSVELHGYAWPQVCLVICMCTAGKSNMTSCGKTASWGPD